MRSGPSRLLAWILVLAALLAAPRALRAGPDYERWYTVSMMGQRAGWMMSSQKTDAGTITSTSVMKFSIGRADSRVRVSFETEFVETLDHKAVSVKSVQQMGASPVETRYTFGANSVRAETVENGRKAVRELPLPEGRWLTAAEAGDYVMERLRAGDTRITVRTLEVQNGLSVMNATYEVLGQERVPFMGRGVDATRWRVTQDQVDAPTVEYVDQDGVPIRVELTIGAISLRTEAATKEEATAGPDAAPEMMVSTFVKPDRRIARPRYKKTAVYTLTVPEGETLADLPRGGAQRAERIDARTVRVTVNMLDPLPAAEGEATAGEYLESSRMVGATDPEVAAMAAEAVKGAPPSPGARAEAIRRYVRRSITEKNLGVGFASASETARTRTGDCTEHAVLLAAVLRAAGIPARLASGLLYTEGFAGQTDVFGYHMWAQALLENDGAARWIDLDATLGDDTAFDATHIALGISALSDGQTLGAMAPMATALGRLSIRVDSAE